MKKIKILDILKAILFPISAIALVLYCSNVIEEYKLHSDMLIVRGKVFKISTGTEEVEKNDSRQVDIYDVWGADYYFQTLNNKRLDGFQKGYGEIPIEISNSLNNGEEVYVQYSEKHPKINRLADFNDGTKDFSEWWKHYILIMGAAVLFSSYIGYIMYIKQPPKS